MMVPLNYLTVLWLISHVTPLSTNKKTWMISTFQSNQSRVLAWWWKTKPDKDLKQWLKLLATRKCPVFNQSLHRSLWHSLISMISNPWNYCLTSWWIKNRINLPHKFLKWREKFKIYKTKSKWGNKSMRKSRCRGRQSKTLRDKFISWSNNQNQPSKSQGENAVFQFRKWNVVTAQWSMCPNLT